MCFQGRAWAVQTGCVRLDSEPARSLFFAVLRHIFFCCCYVGFSVRILAVISGAYGALCCYQITAQEQHRNSAGTAVFPGGAAHGCQSIFPVMSKSGAGHLWVSPTVVLQQSAQLLNQRFLIDCCAPQYSPLSTAADNPDSGHPRAGSAWSPYLEFLVSACRAAPASSQPFLVVRHCCSSISTTLVCSWRTYASCRISGE